MEVLMEKKFERNGTRFIYTLFGNHEPGHGGKFPLLIKRMRPGCAIDQRLIHLDDIADVTGAVLKTAQDWILEASNGKICQLVGEINQVEGNNAEPQ